MKLLAVQWIDGKPGSPMKYHAVRSKEPHYTLCGRWFVPSHRTTIQRAVDEAWVNCKGCRSSREWKDRK